MRRGEIGVKDCNTFLGRHYVLVVDDDVGLRRGWVLDHGNDRRHVGMDQAWSGVGCTTMALNERDTSNVTRSIHTRT